MADTVDSRVVHNGRYYVIHIQNRSDGTGESAVNKVDISTLTTPNGAVCTKTAIDRIEFAVSGMTVRLNWDRVGTDDEIVTLSGNGSFDWSSAGGLVDPASDGTGDILLTTLGHDTGDTYDITLWLRPKA